MISASAGLIAQLLAEDSVLRIGFADQSADGFFGAGVAFVAAAGFFGAAGLALLCCIVPSMYDGAAADVAR